MIVERARLGQLLVAAGSVALVVAVLLIGATSIALSTTRVGSATPELLAVAEVHDAVVDELAAELPGLYEPGRLSPDVARAVAERMVRDGRFVAGARTAVEDAHRRWRDDGPWELALRTELLVPVAHASLRDVDLELARDLPDGAVLDLAPIAFGIEPAGTVTDARTSGVAVLVVGLSLLMVGAFVDPRSDRALRRAAAALFVTALLVGGLGLALGAADLGDRGLALGAFAAVVGVTRTPILVVAGLSILVGAFLWATASQVAPLVEERSRRRERRAAGPEVAASGSQRRGRWWRARSVRQQAIDAFFDEDDRTAPIPAASDEAVERRSEAEQGRVAPSGDGFDQAIAAVEADPDGAVAGEGEDREESDADAAAADRREALERIDGARSRLRTHLPR